MQLTQTHHREGIIGSGKSTTTGFIAEHLHNNGIAASKIAKLATGTAIWRTSRFSCTSGCTKDETAISKRIKIRPSAKEIG